MCDTPYLLKCRHNKDYWVEPTIEGEKRLAGKVVNYLSKISVAIIELSGSLAVGDRISVEGATTNIQQTVESMQIQHQSVEKAGKGDSVGLKMVDRCRKGDIVYKIS